MNTPSSSMATPEDIPITAAGSVDLLYTNMFIPPSVGSVSNIDTPDSMRAEQGFVKYYEQMNGRPLYQDYDLTASTLFDPASTSRVTPTGTSLSVGTFSEQPTRRIVERSATVALDSRDRNTSLYPNANMYRIYLSQRFTNVTRVRMVSSEFPNTELLIKSQPVSKKNNKIYWQNDPNTQIDGGIKYSITITDGNYTALTFSQELVAKLNVVQRELGGTISVYSNFNVSVDNIRNTFTIRQNNNFNLNNPINVTSGSNIVTIAQAQHGFLPGQILNIQNASPVGGIPSAAINTSQVIDVTLLQINDLYRVNTGTTSAVTNIVYGTTGLQQQGRVNTNVGEYVVTGHGTNFLTALTPGNVVHIGYNTYTVDRVISDFAFSVLEPLTETFDGYTLIMNPAAQNASAFSAAANSARTVVAVVNNKLRNINYASPTELTEDTAYQSTFSDLSLKVYKLVQNIINISDYDKTLSIPVTFYSRDAAYSNFNQFTVSASINNFNVMTFDDTNNVFNILSGVTVVDTLTMPAQTMNILQVQSTLMGLLPGWTVFYDSGSNYLYIKPPVSGTTQSVTLKTVTATYSTYSVYSLDFTPCSSLDSHSVAVLLGFQSAVFPGTYIVSTSSVYASSGTVLLDPTLTTIGVLDVNNTLVATISLLKTLYNSVVDLVAQVKTSLLQANVPLQITYNASMGRVLLVPFDTSKTYKLVFQQASAASGYVSLASALGFDPTYIHSNVVIRSLQPVQHFMSKAWYTHEFLDTLNAVPYYPSIRVQGTGIVTNNSASVAGTYDHFYGQFSLGTMTYSSVTGNTLTGHVSGNVWQQTSGAPSSSITTLDNYTYFSRIGNESDYNLAKYVALSKVVDYYTVTLVSGRFVFTAPDGSTITGSDAFTLQRGTTALFDLRQLPNTSRFKLSLNSNGPNAGSTGTEFSGYPTSDGNMPSLYRQYLLDAQFLQLSVPLTDTTTQAIYYYDDLRANVIDMQTNNTYVYYMNIDSSGYITISNRATLNDAIANLTFTRTPVVSLAIGNTYLFDYSLITAQSAYSSETVALSLTVDGQHYFGLEYTTGSFVSYPSNRANTTQLTLSVTNMPFPERLFYYMSTTLGTGGDGYISIGFSNNCGAIGIVNPTTTLYAPFVQGPAFACMQSVTTPTVSYMVAPHHSLGTYLTSGAVSLSVFDNVSSNYATALFSTVPNVTEDNRYFVIEDLNTTSQYLVSITTGVVNIADLANDLITQVNTALGISDVNMTWDVLADTNALTITFLIRNGGSYRLLFNDDDVTLNGVLLYNSAARLLGFSQADTPPDNTITQDLISSSYQVDLTGNTGHIVSVATASLPTGALASNDLAYGELITSTSLGSNVMSAGFARVHAGTRFLSDFVSGDKVVLGEDFDNVFIISTIVTDTLLNLTAAAVVVAATTDQFGTTIPAPTTVYRWNIYKYTSKTSSSFQNGEQVVFFRSTQAQSTYDYGETLVNGNSFTLARISPIKMTIYETDVLLDAAAADTARQYNFNSIANHNMYYVKNNSRYFFTTQYPATSTVSNRGGNPISVGTGIKFSLLFSNTDTPGSLLGFPDVGLPAGDTSFKTVQSNTVENTTNARSILRSEPGSGTFAGSLRVITTVKHNFEYGDTVFIVGHTGSSNDLAINNDEGWTITLYQEDLTFSEVSNGSLVTRGVFYINTLNLAYGGTGGTSYTKILYQPFILSGENYVIMSCNQLANLVNTSNKVPNGYAKIILNAPPGAILYSSFVASDKLFDDQPLPVLEYLDVAFYDAQGELFDFNNIDHSYSLEVFYKAVVTNNDTYQNKTV